VSSSDEARIRLPQLRLDELLEELQARLDAARVLGFAPSLRMEGLIDTDVSKETADHVIAVLSEALTNMARHARADRAEIALAADGHELVPAVGDNGVGIPPDGRRSGLRNMAERAGQLGGRMEWDTGCPTLKVAQPGTRAPRRS
jgi:signal transduction histidine kinase